MSDVNIAGLRISATAKQDLLAELERRVQTGKKTFVTTPYSEFLYHALRDHSVLDVLNRADFAVPDGIGIFWAAKFLSLPLTAPGYWTKVIQGWLQALFTLGAIIVRPSYLYRGTRLKEKIPGSDLVWDIGALAAKHGWSIYLLGGFGDTPKLAADKLVRKSAGKLTIAGYSNKDPQDPSVIDDIQRAKPDMLMVAYGPLKQEQWIVSHMGQLTARLYIGLGGTFDYIAGKQPAPPGLLRRTGLEWFWRLVTQPKRFGRIWNATVGLTFSLVRFKVFDSLPYRQNAVSVVINKNNEVFIARYNPEKEAVKNLGRGREDMEGYWQFPQGGLEPGENIEEGARRELWEETAIRSIKLIKLSEHTHTYKWKKMAERPLLVRSRYHFCGQEQRIVYFRFEGAEHEIHLDQDEFLEYKWVPLSQLKHELHENKQPLADIVLKDLPPTLQN